MFHAASGVSYVVAFVATVAEGRWGTIGARSRPVALVEATDGTVTAHYADPRDKDKYADLLDAARQHDSVIEDFRTRE